MTANEFARLKQALKNGQKVTGIKSYYSYYISLIEDIKIDGNWIWVYFKSFADGKWIIRRSVMHYTQTQKFVLE